MGDRLCDICGRVFQLPCHLKRHRRRKTPCDPIMVPSDDTTSCRYCGRSFASAVSMYRHVRKNCKIANSAEGMEKLIDHTLQRQLAIVHEQNLEMKTQVADLTAMMAQLLALPTQAVVNSTIVNNAGIVINSTIVNIHSWSNEEKLVIPASMLKAAFTENKCLMEYCHLSDEQKTDPERAAPYVLEALLDLTKRAHADPTARNVYLNPRRADQVLVFDESSWQVVSLLDAIRSIFDSVAGNIHRIIVRDEERNLLPMIVQSSAAWIPNLYEDEPEKYMKDAKAHMVAHLQNTSPQLK
jgi:hypothetical protein